MWSYGQWLIGCCNLGTVQHMFLSKVIFFVLTCVITYRARDEVYQNLDWTLILVKLKSKEKFADYWAPVLDCPFLYIDLLANTTSLKFRSRLPNISYRDFGSRVSLHYFPPNGTITEIDQPLQVTITAIDESNNSARCMFWYIGQG